MITNPTSEHREQARELAQGINICAGCGHVGCNGEGHRANASEHATPAPSPSVREAALNAAREFFFSGSIPKTTEHGIEHLATIIDRHCSPVSAAGGDEDRTCTCCGEAECDCGPYVAPDSKVIDDPCRVCGKCINHCPHQ